MVQNKALVLKEYPTEYPELGKHLVTETREFDLEQEPPAGGITVKNHYISFDPYQRGRMRNPKIKSYSPPYPLDKPITNSGISTVVKSANDRFKAGDVIVARQTYFEEYSVLPKELLDISGKLDNPHKLDPKHYLGALGMPGCTAYSSFYEIGEPKKGETIFISAASGAVGQLVGQLAKHEGLKVIGSVGDDKKLEFITKDLGFDAGFNYKKEKPSEALARLAPNGIDIYYENVGGEQLEAAIDNMNQHGRIIACGMISQYNLPPEKQYPIRNLMQIVGKRIRFQGFIVSDLWAKYFGDLQKNVGQWIADGTFKAVLDTTHGIENAGEGLLGLYSGKNFGKAVLEVSPLQ